MAFEEKLPEWNAAGIEPPQSLKNSGYKFNDEPAPDHFNYMFNRAYKVMQELQLEAASSTDVSAVSATVTSITDRLDKNATSALTLARGTQTISSTRDKPFNLTSIRGRMLLNLLGRTGNFETLNGWSASGSSIALNAANAQYGSNSVQVTLNSTSGRVSRSVPTISGRTYIIVLDAKMGTAANARVDVTGIGNGNTVTITNNYAVSYMRFTATSTSHSVGFTVTGSSGQTAFADGLRVYEVSSAEYSAFPLLSSSDVASIYPYTEGLAGVRSPYAIRWTDTSKTQIAAMLAFDTELLASPTATADSDTEILYVGSDGQYYKTSMWRKLQITGSEAWTLSNVSFTGSKRVELATTISPAPTVTFGIKYDGTILTPSASVNTPDQFYINNSLTSVVISQTDSGWGDNYSPSSEEIRAYFYGYKMYDSATLTAAQAQSSTGATYNGTGTKQWVNLIGSPVGVSLPTIMYSGYTPYELMYKRSASVVIPIASEGAITLTQGDNVIEVGSGIIIREGVRPQLIGSNYTINGSVSNSSGLKNKVRYFFQVYRNNRIDQWSYSNFATDADKAQFGLQQAQIPLERYDNNDIYSATYMQMNYYPSSEFKGGTQDNERAIITDLIRDLEQITRRVSANELRKSEKGFSMNWTAPSSLLNGWSNFGGANEATAAYRKDDKGLVYLKGLIKDGATAAGTIIFRLPEGYRPAQNLQIPTTSRNSSGSFQSCSININVSGEVRIENAFNYWLTLVIPPFLAEQ